MKPAATIQFRPGSAPGTISGHRTSLPLDILASARTRLAWVSLMYGLGVLLVFGIFSVTDPDFTQRDTFGSELVAVGISSGIALLVFALTRYRLLSPEQLIDLGLVFQVLGGFGISFVEYYALFGASTFDGFGISWICVWILIFPLIVPSTPGKAFLAALITASTGLLAFTISVAAGMSPVQPFGVWVRLFAPNYISALLALLGAKVVYKLGADVKEARRLGAYELVTRLGAGGMGEVWMAKHRFLSRPAAVKLINPDRLGGVSGLHVQEVHERFEREAQATASLHSPNSIVLYDFGTTDTGVFYYVMELLKGVNLQQLVDRFGPLDAPRVVFLMKQVCLALVDAHGSGLIHRDIKPANIYLCRLGPQADFVKVLDFGLVKFRYGPQAVEVTRADVISGTPGYMAPETILGAKTFDHRADIYSLGCVAYWLLTGHLVFEDSTVEGLLRSHLTRDPLPPSLRGELPVPESVERIVLSCLAKDPAERVQTAADLLALLDDLEETKAWTNRDAVVWWSTHLPDSPEAIATTRLIDA